jgi:uncharacterized protein
MRASLPGLIVLAAVTAVPLQAQYSESARTISVSGEAVVMATPNQAVVTIGVETFDPKLDVASQTNDRIAKKLLAEWKKLGIADVNVQTDGVTVDLSYNERERGAARTVEGYTVRRSYAVIADSAFNVERVIAAGLANGANQLGDVDFRTTEMRKYRDQARVNAVKAAREKAHLIASELGVNVGMPRSITETSGYSGFSGSRRGAAMSQNVVSYASDSGEADSYGAVAPGQIAVRASVAVVFDLVSK